MRTRPVSVTIISWVFLTAGVVGFSYHAIELVTGRATAPEGVWICLIRLLAVLGGVFLLRGRAWARWLLVAWLGYHVILSAWHKPFELVVHGLLFAVIVYFLFRAPAAAFFRGASSERWPDS